MATDILVVDDEADIRDLVSGILEDEGHGTRVAGNSDSALTAIAARRPSLVVLDIWLQGSRLDGLALLDVIQEQHPGLPVVIISGHGNIETAVSAIKRGAYDYIEKPFKADRLVLIADRALEASRLRKELADLKHKSGEIIGLIGSSSLMNQLRGGIDRIAPTNSRVMIFGPSGAGKEQVARCVHAASLRAQGPFVALNAAAITPERMEHELFGTETVNGSGGNRSSTGTSAPWSFTAPTRKTCSRTSRRFSGGRSISSRRERGSISGPIRLPATSCAITARRRNGGASCSVSR